MRKLTDAVHKQLRLNAEMNLLHPEVRYLIGIEPTFLAALEEALAAPKSQVPQQDLAEVAATSLIERIHTVNQFIQVDRSARESLKNIYLRTWEKMLETSDIESSLRNFHYPLVAEWINTLYPESLKKALASNLKIGRVVCQNYSAGLQLDLLKLELNDLKQPILDIGCGKEAQLVEHLRRNNLEAFGIDRSLQKKRDYLMEGSWQETAFEVNRWGTIISHMAFTNHFIYIEKVDTDRVPIYLAKYQEILNSLQLKGSFVYAPDSFALERIVDKNKYSVERHSIGNGYGVTRVSKVAP